MTTVTAFPFEWTDKDISIRVMELSGLPCNQGMVRYRVCFEFDKQGTKSETENALRRKKSGKWLRQTPGRRQQNALRVRSDCRVVPERGWTLCARLCT